MSSTKAGKPAKTFAEQAVALAWGAWVELGVSGWRRTHEGWAIDPEPLILFTAALGDADPRLRDEATDWCVRYWRYVSRVRLKNLFRRQPDDVQEAFGEFAATVGEHAGVTWFGASEKRSFKVTGRSTLPPLDRPSLAWLRLRAMFGLGARTEILRYFLAGLSRSVSVAQLADVAGYVKRNVAEECESLERAGVLTVRSVGNRFSYSLARRAQLEAFVGPLPEVRPDWTPVFNVVREFVALESDVSQTTVRSAPVAVRRALRRMEDDLGALGVEPPSDATAAGDLWREARPFGERYVGAWSVGSWPIPST